MTGWRCLLESGSGSADYHEPSVAGLERLFAGIFPAWVKQDGQDGTRVDRNFCGAVPDRRVVHDGAGHRLGAGLDFT